MKNEVVYIKAELNTIVYEKQVKLKDIAKIYSNDKALVEKLNKTEVFQIQKQKKDMYVVTILKLIEAIKGVYPDLLVVNVGEKDIIVAYSPKKKERLLLEYGKAIFVALVVFFGSAFTIMTFNEDISVKDVLELFEILVMGELNKEGGVLQFSYSLGLPIGIILFFNHFSRFKLDKDPTPLQIQLRLYEKNESQTIIENADRESKTIDVE